MRVSEAAKKVGVSLPAIFKAIYQKKLKARKVKGVYSITEEDFIAYRESIDNPKPSNKYSSWSKLSKRQQKAILTQIDSIVDQLYMATTRRTLTKIVATNLGQLTKPSQTWAQTARILERYATPLAVVNALKIAENAWNRLKSTRKETIVA